MRPIMKRLCGLAYVCLGELLGLALGHLPSMKPMTLALRLPEPPARYKKKAADVLLLVASWNGTLCSDRI
jgi:TctA family transporter